MRAARANEVSWAKRYWYRIAVGFRILAPNRPRGESSYMNLAWHPPHTHLCPPALEPRYATFTGPSQIRALDARSSSSSGSLRPEAAAARSCMNLSTSSTLVGMGAWVVKASGIGNFGQALERHGSLSPAFKRRGLSPQAQRALPSGPRGSPLRPRGRPRQTGGPLEQWVAASSAASEGAF